jgi:hypothetical protein
VPNSTERIYIQTIIVDSGPSPTDSLGFQPTYQVKQLGPSVTGLRVIPPENAIMTNLFSSVPIITHDQLSAEYQELGKALTELTDLDEETEWKIEPAVYEAARYVAFQLMLNSLPTPHLLSHGSQSVVFNWTIANNNLYLTVSADKISALISSPESIKRRVEIDHSGLPKTIRYLYASSDDKGGQPIVLFVTENMTDTSRILD